MVKILPFIGLVAAVGLLFFGNTAGFSRIIIDKISPCVQNPMNSFPCNSHYDIYLMVFAAILGVVSVIFIAKGFIK